MILWKTERNLIIKINSIFLLPMKLILINRMNGCDDKVNRDKYFDVPGLVSTIHNQSRETESSIKHIIAIYENRFDKIIRSYYMRIRILFGNGCSEYCDQVIYSCKQKQSIWMTCENDRSFLYMTIRCQMFIFLAFYLLFLMCFFTKNDSIFIEQVLLCN